MKTMRLITYLIFTFSVLQNTCSAQAPSIVFPVGNIDGVDLVVFSNDNKYLLSSSYRGGSVKLWERSSGHPVRGVNLGSYTRDMAFPDSKGAVYIYKNFDNNTYTPDLPTRWNPLSGAVVNDSLQLSEDGSLAAWSRGTGFPYELRGKPFSFILDRKLNRKIMEFRCGETDDDELQLSRNGKWVLHKGIQWARDEDSASPNTVFTEVYSVKDQRLLYRTQHEYVSGNNNEAGFLLENVFVNRVNDSMEVTDLFTLQRTRYRWPFADHYPTILRTSRADRPLLLVEDNETYYSKAGKKKEYDDPSYYRVILFDYRTGTIVHEFPGERIRHAYYKKTGTGLVVLYQKDSTCSIFEEETGKLKYSLTLPYTAGSPQSISNDGKLICTASASGYLLVYSVTSGKLLESHGVESFPIQEISFSKNERYLYAMDSVNFRIWDLKSGHVTRLFDKLDKPISYAESYQGKKLFVTTGDDSTHFYDMPAAKPSYTIRGGLHDQTFFDSSGNYFINSNDSTTSIYAVMDGSLLHRYSRKDIRNDGFSPDLHYYYSVLSDSSAHFYEAVSGKAIGSIRMPGREINSVTFSPRSDRFATGYSGDSSFTWWNAGTLTALYTRNSGDEAPFLEISPNGKYILSASGYMNRNRVLWRAARGDSIAQIVVPVGRRIAMIIEAVVSFTADGEGLFSTSTSGRIALWNCADGRQVSRTRRKGDFYTPPSVDIIGNTPYLLSRDPGDSTWVLYTAGRLDTVHISKSTRGFNRFVYSPAGDRYATVSGNMIRIGRLPDMDKYYTIGATGKSDYIAVDPEGRFDGTDEARKKIFYVCGLSSIDVDQVSELSHEPYLVAKIEGENPEPFVTAPVSSIPLCNRIPEIVKGQRVPGAFEFILQPQSGGIGELQFFVNGKQTRSFGQSDLTKTAGGYQLRVPEKSVARDLLSSKGNLISLRATTRDSMLNSREYRIAEPPSGNAGNPNLYFVSIGVSKYQSEDLRLHYAANDARAILSTVSAAARKLLNSDGKEHVYPFLLLADTLSRKWANKMTIQRTMDSIGKMAKPEDIFVLFFAGHGSLVDGKKDYYLMTSDASNAGQLKSFTAQVSISTTELRKWMINIRANKQVVIIDACNSGQLIKGLQSLVAGRAPSANQQRALENLRDRTGTFILSASSSDQKAYEAGSFRQGLLTYSLLSTIKNGSALRESDLLDITRWFNSSSSSVIEKAKSIKERQDPQIIGTKSFDIGVADQPVRDSIPLPEASYIIAKANVTDGMNSFSDKEGLSRLLNSVLEDLQYNSNTGFQLEEYPSENSYSLRGNYLVEGNLLTGNFVILEGTGSEGVRFTVTGHRDAKTDFSQAVVKRFLEHLPGKR